MRQPIRLSFAMLLLVAACGDNLEGDTPGGGGPDAGGEPDAGPPFDVTEREWTWFPVDGNTCMDGSATGIGLNLDFASDKLVVFLEGGGACFNAQSCLSVAHQDGFGEAEMTELASYLDAGGILDRDDADNPVAGWSYVFIPYCTGDVHAGAQPDGAGGRDYVGYGNVTRAVQLVADRMGGSLTQVLLTGQSAGGFGAAYNYDQVATIFGELDVAVDLLDDSGPPLSTTYLTPCLQQVFRSRWNLDATLPADCDECTAGDGPGLVALIATLSEKYPDRRLGLVTSLADQTIRLFYGFGYPDCEDPMGMNAATFEAGVEELRDEILAPLDNARAYTIDSAEHVWTDNPLGSVEVDSVTLGGWITALIEGAEGWDTVAPPPG
ncbi:MAG TPA: pectin acetylesterase-family hydrolase [Kofleriaceae bacterium]|nr:pectin acetylesterase-family hydrolase [Kofleriaceae bacterium]